MLERDICSLWGNDYMKDIMLMVESTEENRMELKEIFKDLFDILETGSGREGLVLLEEHRERVKIILLSLNLKEMSGFKFLEKKNQIQYLQQIPVVIIAGDESAQEHVRSFELGVQEFITKPYITKIVQNRVKNVILQQEIMQSAEEIRNLKTKWERDETTGLYKKSKTEELIQEALTKGEGRLHVLLIIDISNLKTVNDTLGHQVGDRVIKIVSDMIAGLLRKTDIVGRVGGDVFCVLMMDVPNMDIVYSKVREIMQMIKYKPNLAIPEYVSLRIGFVSNNREKNTYGKLFQKADEALHLSKQAGNVPYCEYGVMPPLKNLVVDEVELEEQEKKRRENLILIVDDEPMIRTILRNILKDSYGILEAENGVEAWKLIQANEDRIMAIILDLVMPIMNGYQVLEQIKNSSTLKYIPIIVSTAEVTEESDMKSLQLGANIIMHKPVNRKLILKQIENQVNAYKERKSVIKQYMLQKTLIGNRANTFLCTYYFDSKKAEIGENYLEYICEDFPEIFVTYPFHIEYFVLPSDYEKAKKFFAIDKNSAQHEEIEVKMRIDHVNYEWFEINKMVNYNENGKIQSVIFMFLNIEYAVEAKQDLVFMANNDILTHIPNLRTFSDDVLNLLKLHPEQDFLMITMDIFQFRVINKLFGYKEGDDVIKYVATKLQELVEEFDYGAYCRASSDIFYMCISEKENVGEFMQDMQQAMSRYPLKFQIKFCFGIYKIADREESIENMIEHSSYARKKTKEAPITSFEYYDAALQKKETFETVAISEMEDALVSRQFEVYYQPKCDIDTDEIIGAEALIRWKHPDEGYLSPAYFIPIFEQNGTCVELDYFVYEEVCKTIRNWMDHDMPVVPISVNVSRWSLYNEELEKNILEIVNRYEIPHHYIEFEITESAFVLEAGLMTDFSVNMRKQGFRILIDDFGSGYSSLNSLKDISVDVLKIDIKFLPVTEGEEKAEIVLSSIINMGQKLGLDVIAEGVEKKEQIELLRSLGCKCVQGYFYYKPMPYEKFQQTLQEKAG